MKELESVIKTQQKLPVSRATIINVMFSNNWVKDELIGVLKPYDLSLEQFNVLRILRGQKGQPINLQDIQERMVNKMSNTTRLVDKLILKGFVKRTICKNNRRKVEIEITDSGLKTLKEIDPKIDTAEQQITTNLNESELQQLNTLLIKLRTQN
ncbi:MAG: MarR family transcriptional regulator [Bacteroidia bacterium]|nr:MarR family transcriptional regulator [Bacteroidia bacterium]